ncbi:hypothetical protein BM221_006610 [Beauveria bassiana]|uniref:Uncharacterized protein n=1 Tax=Beauveria bassiana TaxID=176275 RepID=A0A2N6NI65_BEABA|nr:hypothetical protein BM221_006610 [Beauveria bassiana]
MYRYLFTGGAPRKLPVADMSGEDNLQIATMLSMVWWIGGVCCMDCCPLLLGNGRALQERLRIAPFSPLKYARHDDTHLAELSPNPGRLTYSFPSARMQETVAESKASIITKASIMPVLDPAPRHDLTAAKSSKNRHQYVPSLWYTMNRVTG